MSQRVLSFVKQPVGWLSIVALVLVVMCCYTGAVMGGLLPSPSKKRPPVTIVAPLVPSPTPVGTTAAPLPTAPAPSLSPSPSLEVSRNPKCHPNYSVCLRIVRDLNCNQIRERDFKVLGGKDPYELDPDRDGIACERR